MRRLFLVVTILFLFGMGGSLSARQGPNIPTIPGAIEGQVLGVDSHGGSWPLSSSGWDVYITLNYLDPETGRMIWANSTDCWMIGQGCADQFGRFQFLRNFDGSDLRPGVYETEVTALGHLVSRVRFNIADRAIVRNELRVTPVHLELVRSTGYIPSGGGQLTAWVRVWNFDTSQSWVVANAMVYGPTLTRSYGQYQVDLPTFYVPEVRYTYFETVMSVGISSDLPDGRDYCVNFRLGPPERTVSEIWACAPKGGPTSGTTP